jgi:hypothetical protein
MAFYPTHKTTIVEANLFKDALLDENAFCITWEQIPGRGAVKGREEVLANAARAAR